MVGDKILEYRKKNNLSQEDLAAKLGVTRQSISLWETNQSMPSLDNIIKLAEIFNTNVNNLWSIENEDIKNIDDAFVAKAQTNYSYHVHCLLNKRLRQKGNFLYSLIISFLLLCLISIVLNKAINQYWIFVIVILIIAFIIVIVMFNIKINKNIKKVMKYRPNLISYFTFYNDYLIINSISDNSNNRYQIGYKEIKHKLLKDNYLLIYNKDLSSIIDLTTITDKEMLFNKIEFQETSLKQIKKPIKLTLLLLFIFSIVSIFMALLLAGILITTSKIPEAAIIPEYMWVCFLFTPFPLVSVILGIIFLKKGYHCKKNIIGGSIIVLVLSVYGSFTFIFNDYISHDYQYLESIESTMNIDFPNEGYISILYNENGNIDNKVMVRFDKKYVKDFVSFIDNNPNWKTDMKYIPVTFIDTYYQTILTSYDYYCIYDKTDTTYNFTNSEFDNQHEYIFLAYDVESNLLLILNINKD